MGSGAAARWPPRGGLSDLRVPGTTPDRWGFLPRRAGGCEPRRADRPSFPFPLGRHPPGSPCGAPARRGWARSRGLATSRAPHSAAAGSRWGVGSRLHLEQGGWRVSGCQWAWICMRLQEVLPVCSSLSFHLPSPLLPRLSSLLHPGGGHPGSGWRGPASACFEIATTAHLVLRGGWEGQAASGC